MLRIRSRTNRGNERLPKRPLVSKSTALSQWMHVRRLLCSWYQDNVPDITCVGGISHVYRLGNITGCLRTQRQWIHSTTTRHLKRSLCYVHLRHQADKYVSYLKISRPASENKELVSSGLNAGTMAETPLAQISSSFQLHFNSASRVSGVGSQQTKLMSACDKFTPPSSRKSLNQFFCYLSLYIVHFMAGFFCRS